MRSGKLKSRNLDENDKDITFVNCNDLNSQLHDYRDAVMETKEEAPATRYW